MKKQSVYKFVEDLLAVRENMIDYFLKSDDEKTIDLITKACNLIRKAVNELEKIKPTNESRQHKGRMLREGRRHLHNRMMKERYMSDEDIEGQYSDWWLMSLSVNAEDNPYQRRENVYLTAEIAFPNSDEEDFDSYRVVGYEKDEDGSVHQYTDVWLPEDVAEDMYNLAVRILSEWKPGDEKIFKSPEEFRSWYKTLR